MDEFDEDANLLSVYLPTVPLEKIRDALKDLPKIERIERREVVLNEFVEIQHVKNTLAAETQAKLNEDTEAIKLVLNSASDDVIKDLLITLDDVSSTRVKAVELLSLFSLKRQEKRKMKYYDDSGRKKLKTSSLPSSSSIMNVSDLENDVFIGQQPSTSSHMSSTKSSTNDLSAVDIIELDKDTGGSDRPVVGLIDLTMEPQPGPSRTSTPNRKSPSGSTTSDNQAMSVDSDKDEEQPFDDKLVYKLMEMFPNAHPDYLKQLCKGEKWNDNTLDRLTEHLTIAENYPKREPLVWEFKEMTPEDYLNKLTALFPDASPIFLQNSAAKLATKSPEEFEFFVNSLLQAKIYPTLEQYEKEQKANAQMKQYTIEFDVEKFLETFPDPKEEFENPNRRWARMDNTDLWYMGMLFRRQYPKLYCQDIDRILGENRTVAKIYEKLDETVAQKKMRKTSRRCSKEPPVPDWSTMENIPLLQELAYFTHRVEIHQRVLEKRALQIKRRTQAKSMNLLQECQCCFDAEVMPEDILSCPKGCKFCSSCVKTSVEVQYSDGKLTFACPSDCDSEFGLSTIQKAVRPNLFSKIAQKKSLEEIKAAGLPDLESCPFCDYANIPAEGDKVFKCLNPDCMKESCRQCKRKSHLPYRCDEVADESVQARVFIENKMTEALLRNCLKCGIAFFKDEGCNLMKCKCGAKMCYVCRQPVTDYTHFNGLGGERYDLCPLYSDNFDVNDGMVIQAAQQAKAEVDPTNLTVDPTVGLQDQLKLKRSEAKQLHQQEEQQRRQPQPPQPRQPQQPQPRQQFLYERELARLRQQWMRAGEMGPQPAIPLPWLQQPGVGQPAYPGLYYPPPPPPPPPPPRQPSRVQRGVGQPVDPGIYYAPRPMQVTAPPIYNPRYDAQMLMEFGQMLVAVGQMQEHRIERVENNARPPEHPHQQNRPNQN